MTYQNPYALSYFLSTKAPQEINYQVIRQKSIDFYGKSLRLAIIGGSHFLYLEDYFFELLTCLPPTDFTYFIENQSLATSFSAQHTFQDLHYSFQLTFQKQELEAFTIFEKQLMAQEHLLFHTFEKESAITSLQLLGQQSHQLRLQTWHTYPENQVVVKTLTTLKI
jgi:hypothetical protein